MSAELASRIFAATVGAYAATNLVAIFASRLLPGDPAAATLTAVLASFGVFAACAIWVFAARTAAKAWAGLVVLAGLSSVGIWLA